MRIEEEYKKTGFFWLPNNVDLKVPGILSIADGGRIELEIVGNFGENHEFLLEDENIKRIIGHVEKVGNVTLDDCLYIERNYSFGGISKSKILISTVLSGAVWDRDEAVLFNTYSFSVDCLDEWIGISGVTVTNDWERGAATISYEPPKQISLDLDNGLKLSIGFSYTLPGYPNLTEVKITQNAYFRLESKDLRDIKEFRDIAFKITNLMCFAMDEIVAIKNIVATSSEKTRVGLDEKIVKIPISIFFQSLPFAENVPKKSWHQMLFRYRSIEKNAQNVINNWLKAYENLAPAFGLYFSSKTGAQKYLDGKFLALAQGLETYHRRTSKETLMEQNSFEKLVGDVLKGCPEEHHNWLNGRLKHGNELSLNKRLKNIIEPFKDYLGTKTEQSKLLRQIVNTRNYLTHYSEELNDQSAKGRELWVLCLKIEVIFNLLFLKIVGFSDDELNRLVKDCESLKQKLNEK